MGTQSTDVLATTVHFPAETIHLKTFIVVVAADILYFASLFVFVGGPLLAGTATQLVGGASETSWFGTIPNIFVVALNVPVGQAADLWGRKWILIATIAVAVVGAVVESRAHNIGTLLVGFCLLGLSLSSLSLPPAVVSEVVPRKYRALSQASMNAAGSLGGVAALLSAGGLVTPDHPERFRIYWYIVAGLYAFCGLLIFTSYNPLPRSEQSLPLRMKLQSLDWIGYALLSPALTLFCVTLNWSENPYQWNNVRILAPFIISIVLIAAFAFYEWRIKRDGMLHHQLFSRNFTLALVIFFGEGLSFFAGNTYISYEVALFHDLTLFDSALRFCITLFASMVTSLVFGLYSTRRKAVRGPIVVGCLSLVVFNVLMATITPNTSVDVFWGYPIFAGVGIGAIVSTTYTVAQLSTPPALIALATALTTTSRSLGAAVGVATNNAIFKAALEKNIPAKIASAVLPLGFPSAELQVFIETFVSGDQEGLASIPEASPDIIAAATGGLKAAYGIAFRNAWIAAACIVLCSVVASIFVVNPEKEFNERIDAPVEVYLGEVETGPRQAVDEEVEMKKEAEDNGRQ